MGHALHAGLKGGLCPPFLWPLQRVLKRGDPLHGRRKGAAVFINAKCVHLGGLAEVPGLMLPSPLRHIISFSTRYTISGYTTLILSDRCYSLLLAPPDDLMIDTGRP